MTTTTQTKGFLMSDASRGVKNLAAEQDDEVYGWTPTADGGVHLRDESGNVIATYSASDIEQAAKE